MVLQDCVWELLGERLEIIKDFDNVIEMVQGINDMDMEVCCTLGMMNRGPGERLKNAGLFAYNHNLDTSKDYYDDVILQENMKTV